MTGVQTCALPISTVKAALDHRQRGELDRVDITTMALAAEVIAWVLDDVEAAS